VDLHRFDADPDLNFHIDSDPYPGGINKMYFYFRNASFNVFFSSVASVADPDLESGAFFTPGSGIRLGKKSGSGSGMNNPCQNT
jgi:hypothetical protein